MPDIIVIGARGIPGAEGGAEKHAEMVFPRLVEKGYAVTLLGIREFIKQEEYCGVRLVGMPTIKIAGTDKLIYHFICFCYAVFARPRMVHLQGLNSALFLILYKAFGLKVVLRYGSADHQYAKWGRLGRLGFRLCERQIGYADHVIAVSRKYKEVLVQRYGLTNVTVVPNGIDPVHVSQDAQTFWEGLHLADAPYVLAVGRLTVDKDYDTLVRAVSAIRDRPVRLVVAGGADEKDYARRLFALGSDRIRFLGRIDRHLLSALYRHCAVYVNCSHHEGLSNAILEAISYGRPIVASAIPANREMPLKDICYFPAGDAAALQARLEQALDAPAAFIAGRQDFSDWDDIAAQTADIYRKLVPGLAAK